MQIHHMATHTSLRHIPALALLLLLCLTTTAKGQPLTIKIQNTTGYRIDSLIVGERYIGTIESGCTTAPLQYTSFYVDTGFPYEYISGKIGDKTLKNRWWSFCGTERYYLEKGDFSFVLTIMRDSGEEYLHLDYPNQN